MDIIRTDIRTQQVYNDVAFKDGTQTHTIDYNPWSDDNGSVTDVTMTLKAGQATIGNESLSANVKTFTVTTSTVGRSIIQAKATAGNNIDIITINILTKDPLSDPIDYGLCG